jgi:Mg/Co/Ni transporter MgtE
MAGKSTTAVSALNAYYLSNFPLDAAKQIESLPFDESAAVLADFDVETLRLLWDFLASDVAASIIRRLDDGFVRRLLQDMNPNEVLAILGQCDVEDRERFLSFLDANFRRGNQDQRVPRRDDGRTNPRPTARKPPSRPAFDLSGR